MYVMERVASTGSNEEHGIHARRGVGDRNGAEAANDLPEGDSSMTGDCSGDGICLTRENKPQIENLREIVGDYGIALFAPLLDFENDRTNKVTSTKMHETITSSSSTTITTLGETESDQYPSEDDDDLDDTNDVNDDCDETANNESKVESTSEALQIAPESIAHIKACPPILSEQNMQYLQTFLPFSIRDYIWERRFVIGLHGDSFCTLLQKCDGYKNSVVVVRTTSGHILGGYASEEWRACNDVVGRSYTTGSCSSTNLRNQFRSQRNSYYGTGQSYIFGSSKATGNNDGNEMTLCVYPWTGHNDYCQICDVDRSTLCMGGVGEFGWIVSDNFTIGRTGPCATYQNPPLIDETTFRIADFEIYTLTSPIAQFLQGNLML